MEYKIFENDNGLVFKYQDNNPEIIIECTYNDKLYTKKFDSKGAVKSTFDKNIRIITKEDFISYIQIGIYYTNKHFDIIEDKIKKHNFYNVKFLKEEELKNLEAIKKVINKPFTFEI